MEEYKAANEELNVTSDPMTKVTMRKKIETKEAEIIEIEKELSNLNEPKK